MITDNLPSSQDGTLRWLAACARARAEACRSVRAADEPEMPRKLLNLRQAHKQHVARLFDQMVSILERGEPLRDMIAAFDLLVYEPTFSCLTGLRRTEELALCALGEGGDARFRPGLSLLYDFEGGR